MVLTILMLHCNNFCIQLYSSIIILFAGYVCIETRDAQIGCPPSVPVTGCDSFRGVNLCFDPTHSMRHTIITQ